ncbi:hypothetical protein G9A89_019225 [Geosiphon pyriformis]|nr:hypothetical protein G9A89_019225 [Geosiphon pyriformis]
MEAHSQATGWHKNEGHPLSRTRSFVDLNIGTTRARDSDPYQNPYGNTNDGISPFIYDPFVALDPVNSSLLNHFQEYQYKSPSPPPDPQLSSPSRDHNGFRSDSIFYESPKLVVPSSSDQLEHLSSPPPSKPKSKNSIFNQTWTTPAPYIEPSQKSKNDIFNFVDDEPIRPPPSIRPLPSENEKSNFSKGDNNFVLKDIDSQNSDNVTNKKSKTHLPRPRKLPGVTDSLLVGSSPPLKIKTSPYSISSPFVHSPLYPPSPARIDLIRDSASLPPLPRPHEINLILLPTQKNLLGIGRHSQVYKAKFSTPSSPIPKMCAAKRLNPTPESQTLGLSEAFILRRLACLGGQHRNIIAFLGIKDEADTYAPNVLYDITTSLLPVQTKSGPPNAHHETSYSPTSPMSLASLSASSTVSAISVDDPSARLVLLLNYCANGSLWDWVQLHKQKIGRKLWMKWARQLASAIERVHAVGIVHHDVKPHNILLTEALDIKLSDFGAALFVSEGKPLEDGIGRGTPPYSPPELVMQSPFPYSFPVDIYSLGVTLYIIGFTAKEPFRNMRNPVELMVWISKGEFWEWEERLRLADSHNAEFPPSTLSRDQRPGTYRFLNGDVAPEGIVKLLQEMLNKDPAKRPVAKNVVARLRGLDETMYFGGDIVIDHDYPDEDESGFVGLGGGAGFDDRKESLFGEDTDIDMGGD